MRELSQEAVGLVRPEAQARSSSAIVIALSVNYALCYMGRLLVGLLIEPIKHDLKLSDLELGVLTGVSFAIAFGLLLIPLARMADRYNRRRAILVFGLLFCASTVLTGLASDFYLVLFSRILVAACEAAMYSLAVSLIADCLSVERRPLGFTIFTAGSWLGLTVGFTLVGYAEELIGWRGSFYLVAALYALALPIILWTVRDHRTVAAASQPSLRLVASTLLRKPTFNALIVIACLYGFAQVAAATWLTALLIRSHHYSQAGAATFMAMSLGLLAGLITLASGKILVAMRAKGPAGPLRVARNVTLTILILYLIGLTLEGAVAPLFLFVALGISGFINAVIMSAVQELAEPAYRATAVAIVLFPDCLIGASSGAFLTGMLSDVLTPAFGSEGLRVALLITTSSSWALAVIAYQYAIKFIGRDAI